MQKIAISKLATKGYLINMDNALTRFAEFQQNVSPYIDVNIERFSAVLGQNVLDKRGGIPHDAAKQFMHDFPNYHFAFIHHPSYVGCTASHYEIVKKAYELGLPSVAAIEDDFSLFSSSDKFISYANKAISSLPKDWKIVSLHHLIKPTYAKLLSDNKEWCESIGKFGVAKLNAGVQGSAGMIYRSTVYEDYLRLFENAFVVSDYGLQHFYSKGDCYIILPLIGIPGLSVQGVESHDMNDDIAKQKKQIAYEYDIITSIKQSCPSYYNTHSKEIAMLAAIL